MSKYQTPRVGVVAGGPSIEKEVSRVSGRAVTEALRETFESVTLFELNQEIGNALHDISIDVVFPALHGPPGEDGTFQGFLEILRIPYVGSGVRASACAMDKALAKQIFRAAGLSVAADVVVSRGLHSEKEVPAILQSLGNDVVVKPMGQGSALGVQFARDVESLRTALDGAFADDDSVLVEQRVHGVEVTVGILERNGVEVFPPIEIRTPTDTWYDYHHRYTIGESEHVIPAEISAVNSAEVIEMARKAHMALGCRDLSRADFIVPPKGAPVLLEVNSLPGMTPTSLYPDGARAHGVPFEILVKHLVLQAWARKP